MSAIQVVKPYTSPRFHLVYIFHNGSRSGAAVIIRALAHQWMPSLKADKPKVVDEVWDEARLKEFLAAWSNLTQ